METVYANVTWPCLKQLADRRRTVVYTRKSLQEEKKLFAGSSGFRTPPQFINDWFAARTHPLLLFVSIARNELIARQILPLSSRLRSFLREFFHIRITFDGIVNKNGKPPHFAEDYFIPLFLEWRQHALPTSILGMLCTPWIKSMVVNQLINQSINQSINDPLF